VRPARWLHECEAVFRNTEACSLHAETTQFHLQSIHALCGARDALSTDRATSAVVGKAVGTGALSPQRFFGPRDGAPCRCVRSRIHAQTGRHHDGPIYLLANWRYFGYQNNPIAVYYCYDKPGRSLQYVVAEVTNTPWGERHSYVLKAPAGEGPLVTEFDKALHVSPFNPMEMTYRWHSDSPGTSLAIQIALFQKNERIFDAVLSLSAEPLNARSAVRAILSYPLMTIKVVLGIYWEALRLFLKGVSLHSHPKRSH